jgi:hypothetical protein
MIKQVMTNDTLIQLEKDTNEYENWTEDDSLLAAPHQCHLRMMW